ncbi:MAG: cellulase family glycosylhydrolase [Pseudomonadota bacterium]
MPTASLIGQKLISRQNGSRSHVRYITHELQRRLSRTRHRVGSAALADSAFADIWGRLAGHHASNSNVLFGLMNEPHDISPGQWTSSANAAVAAIRAYYQRHDKKAGRAERHRNDQRQAII